MAKSIIGTEDSEVPKIDPVNFGAGEHILGPKGVELGRLVSLYGEPLINYCIEPEEMAERPKEPEEKLPYDKGVPPFVVVGLGRCGCHVAAEFAGMAAANRPGGVPIARNQRGTWVTNFFGTRQGLLPALQFEPIMLIGDIDETTFADVEGLMRQGGVPRDIREDFLKLHYQPLAEGGVGHVPVFAEFVSKGLLLLPEIDSDGMPAWSPARRLLLNFQTEGKQVPRLVFYIMSTGGGSGAVSGAVFMRAQSYAKAVSNVEREMYFCGVGIMPSSITRDQTQLINTGRMIVRYLADLNLRLDDTQAYDRAPICQASMFAEMSEAALSGGPGLTRDADQQHLERKPLLPWNALALISNDVMNGLEDQTLTFGEAESNANQYIAQQIFNLAAAQFPAAEFEKDQDNTPITRKNYQQIRLDPNDLKSGLIGPHAVSFAAAPTEASNDRDLRVIDEMFLRALSLPGQYTVKGSHGNQLIEGISVSPCEKNQYQQMLAALTKEIETEQQARLTRESFENLCKIPFFERCPRIIYSLTAPQKKDIPSSYNERLSDLIEWAFPNLTQARGAISWGTTAFYSLSLFVETSVLLVPDVQLAIVNYLRLCWKQRRTDVNDFLAAYKKFKNQDPPITDEAVQEWLGETEQYGVNIPNFDSVSAEYDRKWLSFVERHCREPKRKRALMGHSVQNTLITSREVAAALRYINYANHLVRAEPILDIEKLLL